MASKLSDISVFATYSRELHSLDDMIDEIHRQFAEASHADHRAERCRIFAGKLLLKL